MAKIVRKNSPDLLKDYTRNKKYLRADFSYRCGYCDFSEAELAGARHFHVDHYKPSSKCASWQEANQYSNLIYSCGKCNEKKSDYWPATLFHVWLGLIVINPCEIDPDLHIDRSQHSWRARTLS